MFFCWRLGSWSNIYNLPPWLIIKELYGPTIAGNVPNTSVYPSLSGIALIDNNLGTFLKTGAWPHKRKYSWQFWLVGWTGSSPDRVGGDRSERSDIYHTCFRRTESWKISSIKPARNWGWRTSDSLFWYKYEDASRQVLVCHYTGVGAWKILLIAIGHVPVIAKEIDSRSPFL